MGHWQSDLEKNRFNGPHQDKNHFSSKETEAKTKKAQHEETTPLGLERPKMMVASPTKVPSIKYLLNKKAVDSSLPEA